MSLEIFPDRPLRVADVLWRELDGFEWGDSRGPNAIALRRGKDLGIVWVYVGKGPFAHDRGYRPDAVWFEVFLPQFRNSGPFFAALGKILECGFVTELGNRVDEANGVDGDVWVEDRCALVDRVMKR